MRALLLLLPSLLAAADAPAPAAAPPITYKNGVLTIPSTVAATPVLRADDLQNLVVCTRRLLPFMNPDDITTVAASLKNIEQVIPALRVLEHSAPGAGPEAPHSTTSAAVKP